MTWPIPAPSPAPVAKRYPHVSDRSLVDSRPTAPAWLVSPGPALSVAVRALAGVSTATGLRSLAWVNCDGLAPVGGYLEAVATMPPGVTGIVLGATEVQFAAGAVSTGPCALELWDSAGIVRLWTTAFTPSGTPTDIASSTIAVTPGTRYRFRVPVAPGGVQSSFLCESFYMRPVTTSDSFWTSFVRVEPREALKDTGYTVPTVGDYWPHDEFAHVDLVTSARDIRVAWYASATDYVGAAQAAVSPLVDGYPVDPPFAPAIDAGVCYQSIVVPSGSGARAVSIVAGPYADTGNAAPNTEPRGTKIAGIFLPSGASLAVDEVPVQTAVVYGDSKTEFYSDVSGRDSLVPLLRAAGWRVLPSVSAGGRSLAEDVGTTLTVAACLPFAHRLVGQRPDIVVLAIGRNDWTGSTFSAADQVTQTANILDAGHAVSPSSIFYILTWTSEKTETDVSGTSWNAERAAIAALATGTGADGLTRSTWCKVVDAARLWTPAEADTANVPQYTHDTVHPASEGHRRLAEGIQQIRWPWSPMQLAPSLVYLSTAESSLAGGAPGTAVGTSGSGAGLPTVTFSGTLARACHVHTRIATSGARGSATFDVSLSSGRHYEYRGLTTAASVVVDATLGLTIAFGVGAYDNLMYWDSDANADTWRDLSGHGDDLLVSGSAHWSTAPSGIGGKPALVSGSASLLRVAPAVPIAAPLTIWCVAQLPSQAGLDVICGQVTAGSSPLLYASSGSAMAINTGAHQITATVDGTADHVYVAVINGASSSLRVDGAATADTLDAITLSNLQLGGDSVIGHLAPSGTQVSALGVVPRAMSTAECLNLEAWLRWMYLTP